MKVVICTPVHSHPTWHYTVSLSHLLIEERARDMAYISTHGSFIAISRNHLVMAAIEEDADFILWLDADHQFPKETLSRLLSHGLDFVGCNYARRSGDKAPTGPTARKDGRLVYTTPETEAAGLVEPVDGIGFGVCLTSRRLLDAIGAPWFSGEAEDYDFCTKAVKAGFPPHVDHGLSWQIGHVRESLVTNLHALMDRGRFKLKNNLT